jgi:hypothetical protein
MLSSPLVLPPPTSYTTGAIGQLRALGGIKKVAWALGVTSQDVDVVGVICGLFIGAASIVQESVAGRDDGENGVSAFTSYSALAIVLLPKYGSTAQHNCRGAICAVSSRRLQLLTIFGGASARCRRLLGASS